VKTDSAAVALLLAMCTLSAAAQSTHATPAPIESIEVVFTPEADATARIVKAIGQAKEEILVQSYLFTNRRIGDALLRAHRAGRTVRVVSDQTAYEQGGAPILAGLNEAGIAVYLDAQHGTAHNKIMVIDGESTAAVLLTGSFNFTVAAQKHNAENLLLISGKPELIRAYRSNWLAHQAHSVRLQ
jgi:phosphatidylserine/phosphatidylglycerophosphate/cardiolipin synthase-like enzyme